MDRLGKILRSSKPPQHIPLGIPTNIAAGPLGFRAELDINPKGEQDRLSRLRADEPDSTVTPDKKGAGVSRIVARDEKHQDQGDHAPGTLSTSTAVGGGEHGNDPTGERFRFLSLWLAFMRILMPRCTRRGC